MGQKIVKPGKEVTQLKRNRHKILEKREHITTEPELLHKAVEASDDKIKLLVLKPQSELRGRLLSGTA